MSVTTTTDIPFDCTTCNNFESLQASFHVFLDPFHTFQLSLVAVRSYLRDQGRFWRYRLITYHICPFNYSMLDLNTPLAIFKLRPSLSSWSLCQFKVIFDSYRTIAYHRLIDTCKHLNDVWYRLVVIPIVPGIKLAVWTDTLTRFCSTICQNQPNSYSLMSIQEH